MRNGSSGRQDSKRARSTRSSATTSSSLSSTERSSGRSPTRRRSWLPAPASASASAAGDARVESRALIEREFYRTFAGSEDATLTIPEVTAKAVPVLEEAGDDLGLARAWRLRSEL